MNDQSICKIFKGIDGDGVLGTVLHICAHCAMIRGIQAQNLFEPLIYHLNSCGIKQKTLHMRKEKYTR